MRIGFIGLGNMGLPIASNLIKAHHVLTVHNRTRTRAEELQPGPAKIAETPAQAASDCEALITMLSDDRAMEEVIFNNGKVIDALPAGAVHICMTTISVGFSRRLEQAHQEKNQRYVAATVFGRPDAAAAAKLFVVAGGQSKEIEFCKPIFDAIGQKTFIAGDEAHAANVVKLAGNFLISSVIESLAEALALIRKYGLDPNAFVDFLTGSLFAAPVYKTYGALLAEDKFEPVGFKMPLGFKDNRLLLAAAEEAKVPMPMASLVRDRFLTAFALGMGESDWAAIARISYKDAGF